MKHTQHELENAVLSINDYFTKNNLIKKHFVLSYYKDVLETRNIFKNIKFNDNVIINIDSLKEHEFLSQNDFRKTTKYLTEIFGEITTLTKGNFIFKTKSNKDEYKPSSDGSAPCDDYQGLHASHLFLIYPFTEYGSLIYTGSGNIITGVYKPFENSHTWTWPLTGSTIAGTGVSFPLIKRISSQTLANSLVSVQPLALPSGKLFYFDISNQQTNSTGNTYMPSSILSGATSIATSAYVQLNKNL